MLVLLHPTPWQLGLAQDLWTWGLGDVSSWREQLRAVRALRSEICRTRLVYGLAQFSRARSWQVVWVFHNSCFSSAGAELQPFPCLLPAPRGILQPRVRSWLTSVQFFC